MSGRSSMHYPALVIWFVAVLALGGVSQGLDGGTGRSHIGGGEVGEPFDFSEHFQYAPLEIPSGGRTYTLPFSQASVVGLDDLAQRLGLEPPARASLLEQGFAVTGFSLVPGCDDMVTAYRALSSNQVPIAVTSGSLLHTYHILFDDLLSTLETRHLYDDMWHVSLGLLDECHAILGEAKGEPALAAWRDAAFLAVGLELMKPQPDQVPSGTTSRLGLTPNPREFEPGDLEKYAFSVPPQLAEVVAKEIALITAHAGMAPSPIFLYEEDYSQYVPRGHYTASEKLKNYFRAMMWYGRMTMLLRGSSEVAPGETCRTCSGLVSEFDARIQTLGALILADRMNRDPGLMEAWERTYRVTAFFVGFADDLGPYEYIDAIDQVFGGHLQWRGYSPADQGEIKAKLAEFRPPRIYGGTGDCTILPPFTPAQADSCLAKTKGFRLLGQRFVPDSYILSKLVAPYTGAFLGGEPPFTAYGGQRVFPRGLDVMAVLGSERARAIMDGLGDTRYATYDKAFSDIKAEIDAIPDTDWHQNLYWNWLWSLKVLLADPGSGYPAFMRTDAWRDRTLKTALASWTELRHDTILYVKQSYTLALAGIPEPPQAGGYVEPYPELYNRLLALTLMTRRGLTAMDLLDDAQARRFSNLEDTLERLIDISIEELGGGAISDSDNRFIGEFGDVLDGIVGGLEDRTRKTTLVADVHTDLNSGRVLEEGVGYVDLIVMAYGAGDSVYLAAGPELTYYEFKQPMGDRLTDEAWRDMLGTGKAPHPGW